MLQLIGTLAGVDREEVNPAGGDPFTSTTLRVVSGEGRTSYVRCSRDFPLAALPEVGQQVTLAVWVQPYVSKSTDSLRYSLTSYMLVQAPALV